MSDAPTQAAALARWRAATAAATAARDHLKDCEAERRASYRAAVAAIHGIVTGETVVADRQGRHLLVIDVKDFGSPERPPVVVARPRRKDGGWANVTRTLWPPLEYTVALAG